MAFVGREILFTRATALSAQIQARFRDRDDGRNRNQCPERLPTPMDSEGPS